jgi:hypothetical protein
MFAPENPMLWLIGILVLAGLFVLVRGHFNAAARERRRRDRSHGPVTSRKRGPTVKLAVDMDGPKRKRKP